MAASFVVEGQGQPAAFSYFDDFAQNNYGQLRITISALPQEARAVPGLTPFFLVTLLLGLPLLGYRNLRQATLPTQGLFTLSETASGLGHKKRRLR